MNTQPKESERSILPVLPLRDIVVFPYMIVPLFVGRRRSVSALESVMEGKTSEQKILLVTQKNSSIEDPEPKDLYEVGTLVNVLQLLKLPDGTVKILVEGESRFKIDFVESISVKTDENKSFFRAAGTIVESEEVASNPLELEALRKSVSEYFEQYIKINKKIPADIMGVINQISDYSKFSDTIASYFTLKIEEKQRLLECFDIKTRLELLFKHIDNELDVLQIQQKIRSRVKGQMEKSQRDYYLNEQLKAIYRELHDSENGFDEITEFEKAIKQKKLSKEAKEKAMVELKKLRTMSMTSAEAVVVRNYLDWLLALPWSKKNVLKTDLEKADKILNAHHYSLQKIKERIIEFLAVQARVKKISGQILCLVGPPGVGKTSLGKSIAEATGREFYKISLGGVRDEAEVRGHRRTYIGSMPGKFIQAMRKVNTANPLFLLDEIDKLGSDWRGDPTSALLEVLDPEQNANFNDHYLEVEYDLSNVLFICTANTLNMPAPLLDRLEIIRLSGYTEDEKKHIAIKYLIPKQVKVNGLKSTEIEFKEDAIIDVIRYYTKEAGVRGLEREIAKICRKSILELSKTKKKKITVTKKQAAEYCGIQQYTFGTTNETDSVGIVNGLAWTEVGGELLKIEAITLPGTGKQLLTGHLGEVMQESITAATSLVRRKSPEFGINKDFYKNNDIHVHVPEGAVPKDGPSAGIGMFTAILSALTETPVRKDVAMTGEVTIKGRVLPIGGLKEKLLGAHRGGIKTVLIPEANKKDLEDIPDNVKKDLEVVAVKTVDELLKYAFIKKPGTKPKKK